MRLYENKNPLGNRTGMFKNVLDIGIKVFLGVNPVREKPRPLWLACRIYKFARCIWPRLELLTGFIF